MSDQQIPDAADQDTADSTAARADASTREADAAAPRRPVDPEAAGAAALESRAARRAGRDDAPPAPGAPAAPSPSAGAVPPRASDAPVDAANPAAPAVPDPLTVAVPPRASDAPAVPAAMAAASGTPAGPPAPRASAAPTAPAFQNASAIPGASATPAAPTPAPLAVPGLPPAAVEPPSPDVAPVQAESALPGIHRGGFERWPTAPVGVTPIVTAPDLDAPVQWAAAEPTRPPRGTAAWALGVAIIALILSMFVGWGLPLGLVAIVTAIIALRRPLESRAVGVWALVLGVVSVLYSAGWLLFAATRMGMFG